LPCGAEAILKERNKNFRLSVITSKYKYKTVHESLATRASRNFFFFASPV